MRRSLDGNQLSSAISSQASFIVLALPTLFYAVRAPFKLLYLRFNTVRFLPRSPFQINNLARGASAEEAVKLVREGKAEMLMKGSLHTDVRRGQTRDRAPNRAPHQSLLCHGCAIARPRNHHHECRGQTGHQHAGEPRSYG
jgi:hypothetical protein